MTAQGLTSTAQDLTLFAWQGLSIRVPAGWDMVSTRGDRRSGYVGLADDASIRLEIKWETVRGEPDPADTASTYIQNLRNTAKKSKVDISVRRELKLASFSGKTAHCYEWTADKVGFGMAVRCDECHRLVHVVMTAPLGDHVRSLARKVFTSLKTHSDGPWQLWRFFDMDFASPVDMGLRLSDLKTGCIRMEFGRRARRLEFVRVSLAEMLLGRQSLLGWFREFYSVPLRRWRHQVSEARFRDHVGLAAQGRGKLLRDPGRLIGFGREIRVACWHCEPSNRLIIVRHSGLSRRPEGEAEFEQAVDSMKCCEGR